MNASDQKSSRAFLVVPEPGNSLSYMGSIATFLLPADRTGGNLSSFVLLARSGSEPPPHVHSREDEMYLVLDGELEIHVEGEEFPMMAGPGSMAFLPRAKAHAFIYRSHTARVVFILHSPDGLGTSEDYFRTMSLGPPEGMRLPEDVVNYAHASPEEMRHAIRVGGANGITVLSADEVAERLPLFQSASRKAAPPLRKPS